LEINNAAVSGSLSISARPSWTPNTIIVVLSASASATLGAMQKPQKCYNGSIKAHICTLKIDGLTAAGCFNHFGELE